MCFNYIPSTLYLHFACSHFLFCGFSFLVNSGRSIATSLQIARHSLVKRVLNIQLAIHFFILFLIDISEFSYISVSACPSIASSPIMMRRDSILKHSGSIKTEKRVSIKHDVPILMDFISEKRPPHKPINSTANTNTSSSSSTSNTHAGTTSSGTTTSAARPASLIISKGERPVFKLVRSPSVDHDSDDGKTEPNGGTKHKDDESVPLVLHSK